MKAKCMQSHRSQRKKISREDRCEPEGHRLQRTKEGKGCHPTGGVTPGHGDLGWASQWSGKMNREQKDGPLVLIQSLPLRCASPIPGSGQSCWKRTQLWPPMILNTWTPVFLCTFQITPTTILFLNLQTTGQWALGLVLSYRCVSDHSNTEGNSITPILQDRNSRLREEATLPRIHTHVLRLQRS